MQDSKVVKLLKTLSVQEFNDFGKFINSPLFNTGKKVRCFYSFLEKYFPEFSNPKFRKENLFKVLYPGEEYNDRKIRNILSIMLKHVYDYLSYSEFRRNAPDAKKYLLIQLNIRGLTSIFEHELSEAFKTIEESALRDEDYYYRLYLLESIKGNHFEKSQFVSERQKIYDSLLKEIEYLINHFLIILLKSYLKILNAGRLFNIKPQDKSLEELINYLINNFMVGRDFALIDIIRKLLNLYKESTTMDIIDNIKLLIRNNKMHLKKEDYKFLFIELYNYCKRKQEEGNKIFGIKSFELIKELGENDVFLESDGYMLDHTYINLASSAFRMNEIDWAEGFIIKFKEKLYPENKENAYNYISAALNYLRGKTIPAARAENYAVAIKHLSRVVSPHLYYYPRVKNLYLIIYYELGEVIPAMSLIDSYRHYLKYDKTIPSYLKERYGNFLSFVHRLFKLKENFKPEQLDCIKKEINSNDRVEYKGWLLEQIKEFEKNT